MKKKLLLLHLLAATFFANAQNVGIGTTNPVFKLDVRNGSINTDSVYRVGATTVLAVPGEGNLFIGKDAGRINTGFYNTFSGNVAGLANTTGGSNSFFGQTAGYVNTAGDNNSFFGRSAGSSNTSGNSNSFYGRSAAYANTTGNYNTAIGNSSLTTITIGTLNTALGYNANVNTVAQTNATAIGANARVDCDNCLVLGSVNGINGAASGVNVGIGITSPNTSALLDVSSTTKGFLPPRMTSVQRDAIPSPVAGLQIWCIDCKQLQVYDGSAWRTASDVTTYYPIVGICCQSWMTKNLDVATYRNGDPIPKVTDDAAWAALTTGAYCYYNNDSTTYAATYGKLYNWYAVNDPRGLAPMGWHIPSDFEWTTLSTCLGGDGFAGGAMKETGTTHWYFPNSGATNISNFTGLPGGHRYLNGQFVYLGNYGYWWSSLQSSATNAWFRYLDYDGSNIARSNNGKVFGYSVRCLRD